MLILDYQRVARRAIVAAIFASTTIVRSDDQPVKVPTEIETVETRLVQIDLTLEGDPAVVRGLQGADFSVYVGPYEAKKLILDQVCGRGGDQAPSEQASSGRGASEASRGAANALGTVAIVLDEQHLTLAGRKRAIAIAEHLVNRLCAHGVRVALVASGNRLDTVVPLTRDVGELEKGLDALASARGGSAAIADTESFQEDRLLSLLRKRECADAFRLAGDFVDDERARARQAVDRLRTVVDGLANRPPPRLLVYFSDSLREKAGLHFLHEWADFCPRSRMGAVAVAELMPAEMSSFEDLRNHSVTLGVHFMSIEAQGLVASESRWASEALRHTEDTLEGLSLETGGRAFLRNTPVSRIVDETESRVACPVVLSFSAEGLPADSPEPLTVKCRVRGIRVRAQGRLLIRSSSGAYASQMLDVASAHDSDEVSGLHGSLIATGWTGKVWTAELQARARGGNLGGSSYELSASVEHGGKIFDSLSVSAASDRSWAPIVAEKLVEVPPGASSVLVVGRNLRTDTVVSRVVATSWPDPSKGKVVIAPITVRQMTEGVIAREGRAFSSASVSYDEDEALDPAKQIVFSTVVCRNASAEQEMTIERDVSEPTGADFAPMRFDPGGGPCTQVVDVLPRGRFSGRSLTYRVRVETGSSVLIKATRIVHIGEQGGEKSGSTSHGNM